ncbi:MAG: O-antigen ligase family protein [Xanthomonadales bacterium]|nr:O-antigen ligase family protein [Xanthomonadales bacterium]
MSTTNSPNHADPTGWRWAPIWVLAYVAMLPATGIAEAILSLGALTTIGLMAWARFRGTSRLLSSPAWALTTALFFAYWLPELISSIDAVEPMQAIEKSLLGLRYLPFLWLAAIAVATPRARRITFGGLGAIVGLWCVDALIQAMAGHSPWFAALDALKQAIQHRPMCPVASADRLTGPLGPCNPKLGIVLASLSPFALYGAQRLWGQIGWLAIALLVGVVIVLAGSRASWISYALVLLVSGWTIFGWKRLFGVFVAGALVLVVANFTVPQVHERIVRTQMAMAGDESDVDQASAGRVRIWSAAVCMIRQHPVNGVGTRDFRESFPACDPQPGVRAAWGDGPALHAHQLILEILSETGIIGLLLWIAGAALAWRAWRFASVDDRERARPAMLALGVTLFPFNTHLAFYSAFWGGITLLLAALYAGSLLSRETNS